ncbi:hypothetical protein BURPSPAST_AA1100 [Burkholderia pseudomallei Pasteur 52237]|nr:hypothetical protein BURPSPAST_AA1100 [Burkholderia pseudomallei Pasteur 52237]
MIGTSARGGLRRGGGAQIALPHLPHVPAAQCAENPHAAARRRAAG